MLLTVVQNRNSTHDLEGRTKLVHLLLGVTYFVLMRPCFTSFSPLLRFLQHKRSSGFLDVDQVNFIVVRYSFREFLRFAFQSFLYSMYVFLLVCQILTSSTVHNRQHVVAQIKMPNINDSNRFQNVIAIFASLEHHPYKWSFYRWTHGPQPRR